MLHMSDRFDKSDNKFDNEFINKINEYNIESTYIVQKITDSEDNLIKLKINPDLQKWINIQKNKDNLLKYLTENNFEFSITEINLSHYLSESDEILVNSYGNFGLKLNIKYKDFVICEKSLCIDDFNFGTKELIIKNIKNNLENIKNNYIYVTSFIFNELTISQKQSSIEIKNKYPISISAIPQVAGNY